MIQSVKIENFKNIQKWLSEHEVYLLKQWLCTNENGFGLHFYLVWNVIFWHTHLLKIKFEFNHWYTKFENFELIKMMQKFNNIIILICVTTWLCLYEKIDLCFYVIWNVLIPTQARSNDFYFDARSNFEIIKWFMCKFFKARGCVRTKKYYLNIQLFSKRIYVCPDFNDSRDRLKRALCHRIWYPQR